MQIKLVGFTLVELVLVLVIIGLLSAVAIPRYIEVNTERESSEKQNISDDVRSALAVAQADTRNSPDVVTLASYVQNKDAVAIAAGIQLRHQGNSVIVPTYLDENCTNPTTNTRDAVKCVGEML